MANKYIRRYSTWLVIREMRIEITMRYLYTSTRVATIEKIDNSKCGKLKFSYIVDGNVNGTTLLENS